MTLIHLDLNSEHYKLEFRVISRRLEPFTQYIYKLIRHNSFESHQKKDIEVPLDVLLFYNDTYEQKQDILEEK